MKRRLNVFYFRNIETKHSWLGMEYVTIIFIMISTRLPLKGYKDVIHHIRTKIKTTFLCYPMTRYWKTDFFSVTSGVQTKKKTWTMVSNAGFGGSITDHSHIEKVEGWNTKFLSSFSEITMNLFRPHAPQIPGVHSFSAGLTEAQVCKSVLIR